MGRNLFASAALAALVCWSGPTAMADGTVDGVIGAEYGAAVATDPSGDGASTPILDLTALHLYQDATKVYLALTITGDITATWGQYFIYIETDNATNTAPSNAGFPWGHLANADGVNLKPKFVACTSIGSSAGTQVYSWDGSAWVEVANTWTTWEAEMAHTAHIIEISIPKAVLGNPESLKLEAFSSGDGTNGPLDTVPTDIDGTWTTAYVLDNPTGTIQVPVELSGFAID